MVLKALTVPLVLVVLAAGCASPPPAPPKQPGRSAVPAGTTAAGLIAVVDGSPSLGPASQAAEGDFLIENSVAAFAVTRADRRLDEFAPGPVLVDATPASEAADLLRGIVVCLDGRVSRRPRWKSVTVADAGGQGRPAAVVAEGRWQDLAATLRFELAPNDRALKTTLELSNEGSRAATLGPSLAVYPGRTRRFSVPLGFGLGRPSGDCAWLGFTDERTGWGVFPDAGGWTAVHAPAVSVLKAPARRIEPGKVGTWSWAVVVTPGGLAPLCDRYWREHAARTTDVALTFRERDTNAPLAGVEVRLADGKGVIGSVGRSGPDGKLGLLAPEQPLAVSCTASGRPPVPDFILTPREETARGTPLSMGPVSVLRCTVQGEGLDGRLGPVDAVVLVRPLDRWTPEPDFGPEWDVRGAGPAFVVRAGRGEVPLPPAPGAAGLYAVSARRGPAESVDVQRVSIAPGEQREVAFTLRRLFDPAPYVAVDFGQAAPGTLAGLLTPEERALMNRAEGLDGALPIRPLEGVAGLSGAPPSWPASAAFWRQEMGRCQCWPIESAAAWAAVRDQVGALGESPALEWVRRAAPGRAGLMASAPTDPGTGIFALAGFRGGPEDRPLAVAFPFDVIEVLSGRDILATRRNLVYWFQLLNSGYRTLIVGSSGSGGVVWDEAGLPRTWVALGERPPEDELTGRAARTLLSTGDAFVSTGPFIRLRTNGRDGFGRVVPARGGQVRIELAVLACPTISLSQATIYLNGEPAVQETIDPGETAVERLKKTFDLPLDRDGWIVVVVRGDHAMSARYVGKGLGAALPLAVTNPVWLDADGDGRVTPRTGLAPR